MDISILSKTSIRIYSKHATFVVDPDHLGSKTTCDAIVFLNNSNNDLSKIIDYRVVINGPGEYEVNGAKVLGVKSDKGFVYSLSADGLSVIFGRSSEVSKIKDDTYICQILALNVDDEIDLSTVTKLEPKVVILYGDSKGNAAKILGKQNLPTTKKFSVLKDKLPEEMEVVLLASSN